MSDVDGVVLRFPRVKEMCLPRTYNLKKINLLLGGGTCVVPRACCVDRDGGWLVLVRLAVERSDFGLLLAVTKHLHRAKYISLKP
jgi:hypothetical protein